MSEIITFGADSIHIKGPSIDKTMTITFKTGEYQAKEISKLLEQSVEDVIYQVKVEVVE